MKAQTLAASILSTTRPIPCPIALLVAAALFAVPGTVEAYPQESMDQESANVEFRHTGSGLAVASESGDAAWGVVTGMSMAPQLADNLALLFEKFASSEFIVCLEGEAKGGKMTLRDFRMPHIAYSRATSAALHPDGGCDQYDGVIGTLHNHPGDISEGSGPESGNCYLSQIDITSWLGYSEYPYTAVMCGPRLWAWWHRSQVERDALLSFPVKGQLVNGDRPASVTVH